MGIKYFFSWLRVTYPAVVSLTVRTPVDNLYIDLNGLLHPLAQKFYEYGDHKHVRLLSPGRGSRQAPVKTVEQFARVVLEKILSIVRETGVSKRIVIAVDGVAPVAKQCQQRKRRYRATDHRAVDGRRPLPPLLPLHPHPSLSSNGHRPFVQSAPPPSLLSSSSSDAFDPVRISIATEFMTELCQHLAKCLRECPLLTQEVVFSDIYVPGEGEHKIIQMIRKAPGDASESHCIHTLDADVIVLAYLTPKNVLIYREFGNDISWINIPLLRRQIGIPPEDLAVMTMVLGNDFLPSLPGLEIRKGIVNTLIRGYRLMNPNAIPGIRSAPTIFTVPSCDDPSSPHTLATETFSRYLEWVANNCHEDQHVWGELVEVGDVQEEVAQNYIDTLAWNFQYYAHELVDWETSYAYNYALPAETLARFMKTMKPKRIEETEIPDPILQLVCIVPRYHLDLVPKSMRGIFYDPDMRDYYSTDLKVVHRKRPEKSQSDGCPYPAPSPYDEDYTIFMKYVDFHKVRAIYRRYSSGLSPDDARFNAKGRDVVLRPFRQSARLRHAPARIPPQ